MRNSISDNIYYSTVKIEGEITPGELKSGTAFFLHVNIKNNNYIFLATNKHVVENTTTASIVFHKADNMDMQERTGEYKYTFKKRLTWQNNWYFHPNPDVDLAIFNFSETLNQLNSRKIYPYFKTVSLDNIPSNEDIKNILALEQVTFVGYPAGLIDTTNNLPIARKGYLATPLHENFCGKSEFLIDASVFAGSSGSPVFIYNENTAFQLANGNSYFSGASRFWFIGVIYATSINFDKDHLDLGVVVKSECVKELVNFYIEKMEAN